MMCDRGGCPGSGGNQPHPFYAIVLMIPVVAILALFRYFGAGG